MSAGSRAGAGGGIPANAGRVVQDLKEIVKSSDDEIYAMLKECHMDPNETVQRLLNQDTFHEVKRKREKKKENANKESGEIKPGDSGASPLVRGPKVPDRGNGWGNYTSRYNPEFSGGWRRVQSFSGRDNGMSQNAKAPSMSTPALPVLLQAEIKAFSMGSSVSNTVGAAISDLTVVSNGITSYTNMPQVTHGGGWSAGSGHATKVDVIKLSYLQEYATVAPLLSSKTSSVQQLTLSNSSLPPALYASTTDPILHPALEPSAMGLVVTKQDVTKAPVLSSSVPESLEAPYQNVQPSTDDLSSLSLEADVINAETDATSTSVKAFSEGQSASELQSSDVDGSFETPVILSLSPSAPRTMLIGDHYNDRVIYQAPQQPVASKKGSGPEWKPKSPMRAVTPQASVAIARMPSPASPQASMGILSDPTSKFQQLSMQDDQRVIIPNHFQVPEAEQTHLSFGSYRDDILTPFSTNLASEDNSRTSAHIEDDLTGPEPPTELFNASSFMNSESLEQNHTSQSTASLMESFVGSDNVSVSLPANVISPVVSRPEGSKTAPIFQQSSQYTYLSGVPNYTSFGIMPQLMGTQYNHESAVSQQQDLSRLPRFVSPLSDLGTNYYSPFLRSTAEVEAARYSHFMSTNAAAYKLNPGATLRTGQGFSSSQEGAIPATGPTTQAVGIPQTGHTVPQTGHTIPHVSIHAYPAQHAGIPLAPLGANIFGLHYVPPNYGYMPSPYQHSFGPNTGYPQAHSANNYTDSSPYVPTGTAAMKYALPQYKPGAAASSTAHATVAAGYGSFSSPAGFATVATPTAPGYDDASETPFKENNIYIPSQQQGEGSTVWVQTPLSRDMMGIQNNSFYTLLGQDQLTGYAHTPPTHVVPATAAAYTNLYHPSQSGMPPAVHQLLQQSQPGGGVVGGAGQIGAYQQVQRGQLNWANTY